MLTKAAGFCQWIAGRRKRLISLAVEWQMEKDEKDEKQNPHTVTVGKVLCGQSITNQSLKVLVLPLEDVLHYSQTFNVVTDRQGTEKEMGRAENLLLISILIKRPSDNDQSKQSAGRQAAACRWRRGASLSTNIQTHTQNYQQAELLG
ncbi:hypothetical protein PAMP_023103 [Pampus punctatissimus]